MMASIITTKLHLFSFIFFLFYIVFSIHASPFDFLHQLKGNHKGNGQTKGIHLLKNYLQKFGYLNLNQTYLSNDDFDDVLESAIKTYQNNYHIEPTGVLDSETILKMATPRCGMPDIINGVNSMHPGESSNILHTVSHYSFFPGSPKWPASKTQLTYRFLSGVPSNAIGPVISAFGKWANATSRFTFSQAQAGQTSDLVIAFLRLDHGDGNPFDGPLGVLAHAFPPTRGALHYDADEQWAVGSVPNTFDLETLALHEIGHLLGLGHSSIPEAAMYSGIGMAQVKTILHPDDIQGIRALYNV